MTAGDDRLLEIVFVEPWDFVTDVGDLPYTASVSQLINSDELELVLRIDDASVYRGTSCARVRVIRRHEDDTWDALCRGTTVHVNGRVENDDRSTSDIFFIADLRMR